MSDEQQTQQADDPSGPGWRDVTTGGVTQDGDMVRADDDFPLGRWVLAEPGETVTDDDIVRRRIESQPQPNPDDPGGPGWRDVGPDEIIEQGDVYTDTAAGWMQSDAIGRRPSEFPPLRYRRRIEQQQPSDSEPETIDSWEMRLAKMTQWNSELEALVAEAERSGQQVNAELQQLREQVQTLTQELKDKSDSYQICLRDHYKAGQRSTIDRLLIWLRPVVKVVSDHPDHTSILAASVLEFLPQIASRLIEE